MSEKQKREPFVIRDTTVVDQTVNLDGNRFERVTFKNCVLVYRGGLLPDIQDCKLEASGWELSGAAARTAAYLKQLAEVGEGQTIADLLGIDVEAVTDKEAGSSSAEGQDGTGS